MIEYVIRSDDRRGKEWLRIYQDYDLAQIILSVDDKPVAKVPIAELEKVLKAIKEEQNEK